ncbi:MAG: rRNA maturation RNase YbeY [Verrucomicrobiia bacterium]
MKLTGETAKPELALRNKHPRHRVNSALLRRIILTALSEEPIAINAQAQTSHELCVVLVDDTEMERLNRRWLGHAGTTDVIAFDHSAGASAANPCCPLRGDIVISLDEAKRQARRFHTAWQSEVVRYLVHGLLHLRGFDDSSAPERQVMKQAENKLLKRLRNRFDLSGIERLPCARQPIKRICDP